MTRTIKIITINVISLSLLLMSCNDDDNNQNDDDIQQNRYEGCCSTDPVFGNNVDNLDQSAGAIDVFTIVTQNGDGINDFLIIENLDLYPIHTVTIYNSDNEQIFETIDYTDASNLFPGYPQDENDGANGFPNGTYRYKIVIENEEIFRQSGSFCMYTWADPEPDFQGCSMNGQFDPIVANPPN